MIGFQSSSEAILLTVVYCIQGFIQRRGGSCNRVYNTIMKYSIIKGLAESDSSCP